MAVLPQRQALAHRLPERLEILEHGLAGEHKGWPPLSGEGLLQVTRQVPDHLRRGRRLRGRCRDRGRQNRQPGHALRGKHRRVHLGKHLAEALAQFGAQRLAQFGLERGILIVDGAHGMAQVVGLTPLMWHRWPDALQGLAHAPLLVTHGRQDRQSQVHHRLE